MLPVLKAASDSASCLRTASTVNREIGTPKVDFVSREMNRTIVSDLSGTPFKIPTYFPPPASTIAEISASFKLEFMVFKPLVLVLTYRSASGLRIHSRQLRRRRLKLTADELMPYIRIQG
jgi:hypothetical protein